MAAIPHRLVLRNLLKHPVRTLLTMGSLTVALFLLSTLRSLLVTLESVVGSSKTDRLIVQSAVSLFVDLPPGYEGKIRGVEGVGPTCRMNWFGGFYQDPSNFFAQFAIDGATILQVFPEMEIVEGSEEAFLKNRRSAIIGSDLVRDFGWEVGGSVPLLSALYPRTDGQGWEFEVAAVYHSRAANFDNRTLFFHYQYLEKSLEDGVAEGPGQVGLFMLRLAPGADRVGVMSRVDALFENGPQRVQTTTEAEFQAQFVSMLGNLPLFVGSIGGGVLIAIFLANLNTMLMAAREQTRDVGILKALGFRRGAVFWVLLLQSLAISALGGGLGVLLAYGSADLFAALFSQMFPTYTVTAGTAWLGLAAALAIGLLAGVAPALRLSRLPSVASLRMEV
jgi:putative ABC transport system permease protein